MGVPRGRARFPGLDTRGRRPASGLSFISGAIVDTDLSRFLVADELRAAVEGARKYRRLKWSPSAAKRVVRDFGPAHDGACTEDCEIPSQSLRPSGTTRRRPWTRSGGRRTAVPSARNDRRAARVKTHGLSGQGPTSRATPSTSVHTRPQGQPSQSARPLYQCDRTATYSPGREEAIS